MKLRELAEVKEGMKIPPNFLMKERKPSGLYFQVLQRSDFIDKKSNFVLQKTVKRQQGFSNKLFLFYGDYIIYKKENRYKIVRYEDTSGQTIAGDGLFVISTEFSILKDFFSSQKNREYIADEIQQIELTTGNVTASKLKELEIHTDDILELEYPSLADQIGIRSPINFADVPFNIYQKPLPIDKLLKRIKEGELLLDTEFQRRPGLWDLSTKSRLIESMIIRVPIPAFYFDGSNDSQWLVIDGLQRLSAVDDFVNNRFVLSGLDYLPELENKSFRDLERPHQRNIEEFEIFAYIIQKGTPKQVIYKIFKNINTSALKLEPQEIRHALNPGPPAEILKKISEAEWFQNIVILTDRQRDRMEDREVALRFFAFRLKHYTEYRPPITDFLDNAMTDLYNLPDNRRKMYMIELEQILIFINKILGNKAFTRSLFDSSRSYGHNNIMFELLTYAAALISAEKRNILMQDQNFTEDIIRFFKRKGESTWEYENAYSLEGLRSRFSEIEIFVKSTIK